MYLVLITACHCLYWLPPVPYAKGSDGAAGSTERPCQLEYG
jgi:hypothetical protein